MTRMTPDQIQKAGPEAMHLLQEAKQQLEDHKKWLQMGLSIAGREDRLDRTFAQEMIAEVEDIVLRVARPEPAIKQDGVPTITIVYDYPDRLLELLCSKDCPRDLYGAMGGAIIIKRKELDK